MSSESAGPGGAPAHIAAVGPGGAPAHIAAVGPGGAPVHIAVVGPGDAASPGSLRAAEAIGALVAEAGAVLVTGGGGGVMAAAAAGCAAAGGLSVGLLPGADRSRANPHSTLAVPTGLGELRNGLVVRAADAVICVSLSWGTLSEVALAMRTGVPVIMLGPWEGPLVGPAEAATPEEAVAMALGAAGHRRGPDA